MEIKVHLVSFDSTFVRTATALFADYPHVQVSATDVRKLEHGGVAFVSPANSLLFMDGGIDYAYSRDMFPGVEREARNRVHALGKVTALGRRYLPVGSAIVVPVASEAHDRPRAATGNTVLICAPTMFLPHDVSGTRNAYDAFVAALVAFRRYREVDPTIQALVAPSMCCGYGRMDPAEAARQMHAAYVDVVVRHQEPPATEHAGDPRTFITHSRDEAQPDNYDTREIKHVAMGAIKHDEPFFE
jgi:O-acetyl-ADP-ribose deacetylase (regulator of RNase III)